MERPGEKLRQVRERLRLTYRDVVEASQKIAQRRCSEEFAIALSRLADIENKGTLPTIYRLYTLCAIYRLDWKEVLRWYGVPVDLLAADGLHVRHQQTHALQYGVDGTASLPSGLDRQVDLNQTTLLHHIVGRWGKLPLSFLAGVEDRHLHYAVVGTSDWSMYPILQPGSLLLIDQNRRKIVSDGWSTEFDRPIYFLEHRDGYHAGWCSHLAGGLLLEPHPASQYPATLFEFSDIDVVGQVAGVAMLLESKKRRHARTSIIPVKSPNP
jgi:transcriptional regulator with XRE-family HTH domain